MCCGFWQLVTSSTTQKGSDNTYNFDLILTQNFVFTLNYLFDTIKVTTKKTDMVRLWYLPTIFNLFFDNWYYFYLNVVESIIYFSVGIL